MGIQINGERKPATPSSAGYEFVVHFHHNEDLSALLAELKEHGLKVSVSTLKGRTNGKMFVRFPANRPKPKHKEEVALRIGCRPEDVEEVFDLTGTATKGEYHQRKVA